MGKLSKEAVAVMAMCERTKENFGITVEPRRGHFSFCWGFKIKESQGKREGYDKKTMHGAVSFDTDFNGCPYCGCKLEAHSNMIWNYLLKLLILMNEERTIRMCLRRRCIKSSKLNTSNLQLNINPYSSRFKL